MLHALHALLHRAHIALHAVQPVLHGAHAIMLLADAAPHQRIHLPLQNFETATAAPGTSRFPKQEVLELASGAVERDGVLRGAEALRLRRHHRPSAALHVSRRSEDADAMAHQCDSASFFPQRSRVSGAQHPA